MEMHRNVYPKIGNALHPKKQRLFIKVCLKIYRKEAKGRKGLNTKDLAILAP
jgi:hypothetical protein